MGIQPITSGIHHLTLRCSDMETSKAFYRDILGLPLIVDIEGLMAFLVGPVIVAFRPAAPRHNGDNVFYPFNIGLDHLAMTCSSEEELNRFAEGLAEAGVENTGVKFDELLQKKYIAFKDPDRIQWEFYMQ